MPVPTANSTTPGAHQQEIQPGDAGVPLRAAENLHKAAVHHLIQDGADVDLAAVIKPDKHDHNDRHPRRTPCRCSCR